MKFTLHKQGKWSYYAIADLTRAGIVHGFFTASSPGQPLSGTTKKEFLDAFGLKDLIIMHQTHSDEVHTVTNGERPSSGDGIIMTEKNIAAVVQTADCLPVILIDTATSMAAIVHAGWRGTVQRITAKAVKKMRDLNTDPDRIVALFGPAIGPCCYEVKQDVYDAFRKERFPPEVFRAEGDRLSLNLKKANFHMLEESGVGRIIDLSLCTHCTGNLFHSYRRGERNLRQINFVSITR